MAKRIIGIVLAVVLATVGTVVLVAYVRTAEQRALAGERTVEVLVVARPIDRGMPAEALVGAVRTERIPAKVQAVGSVASLDALAGKVTAVALVPGEQIVAQRFVEPGHVGAVEIPEGLLQVTVQLESQRAVGGLIRAGDTVAVVASFTRTPPEGMDQPAATSGQTTHLILNKVLVTAVAVPGQAPTADGGEQVAPAGNLLVTLALDAPSVERVVFAAEHGSLWLSAEPGGAPEDGTRVQTMETIYR
jgi:pilus assembly protein CpaB